jgi:signal transduction histidine kinase
MKSRYEREAYQFLAVYRFLAYALAVLFSQVTPGLSGMPPVQSYIILSILGLYTVLKVFSPLRWQARGTMTYLILVGDFVLAIVLVLYTNGLNSVFLLYSLTPIMTAALLFEERMALSLAAFATLALSLTHLAVSQFSPRFAWIMQGHNLTLLIVYALFSFVSATVPYRINLNIRRRIEREAIIEERRRIARELHDGIAQSLSFLNLKTKAVSESVSSKNTIQALTDLNDIREVVQDTYEDIRESIDQLSTEIRTVSVTAALSNYAQEFSSNNNIAVHFNPPKGLTRLSTVAELQLLRIAQEALTNVRRHAMASEVSLRLENSSNSLKMIVKDNGQGFDLYQLEKSLPGYHGLTIIRERAEGLGGSLDIVTDPGEGTEIKVSLPIEKVRL